MTESIPSSTADALVFGAHPDDVEMGCGGLVCTLTGRGRRVVVVDLSRGEIATRGTAAIRLAEADAAAAVLGVTARENLELPDGSIPEGGPARELVVSAIRRWRPRLILAPPIRDLHPDHTRAGRLVLESHYLAGIAGFSPGLPAHRANQLIHYLQHWRATPSFVADITSAFDQKMAAVRCYRSQFFSEASTAPQTNLSREEFLSELEVRDRYHGMAIGTRYGEPFVVEGPPRVDDPLAAWSDPVPPTGRRPPP
jgi:bacillithiol biosynthesis deacetylase BshB1